MQSFRLADSGAFIRYHDLPGLDPPRVYLAGLGAPVAAAYAHIVAEPPLLGRRTLLVDCLGFGLSDRPVEFSYTLSAHADAIVSLLDGLGLTAYELIGHSFGGSVAILIAARRPERVAGLVVAEPNLDPGGGVISTGIAAQHEDAFVAYGHAALLADLRQMAITTNDQVAASLVGMLRVADPRALHRSARSLVEMPPPTARECLVSLRMPRALVIGARTPVDEVGSTDLAAWPYLEGLEAAGVRVYVVPDAGHAMVWENPSAFARCTAEALETAALAHRER